VVERFVGSRAEPGLALPQLPLVIELIIEPFIVSTAGPGTTGRTRPSNHGTTTTTATTSVRPSSTVHVVDLEVSHARRAACHRMLQVRVVRLDNSETNHSPRAALIPPPAFSKHSDAANQYITILLHKLLTFT